MNGDWPGVSAIYLEGIATGNATFETLAPTWDQWDRAHLPFVRMVARVGRGLGGWAALSRSARMSKISYVALLGGDGEDLTASFEHHPLPGGREGED